jgi:hypothetical protein
MILKSFGCSFIFGTDLADDGRHLLIPTPSNHTWPAHLAQHLGYEYHCYARPGSGNLQIAERVLSHAIEPDCDLFVIGWTWIDRFDYTNSNIRNNPIASKWNNWRTIMPIDSDEMAEMYYKGLHSEYRDKLCSLMYIKLVIDSLQQRKIPFLITYQDNLLFDQQWNHTPAVLDLQNQIKPYMIDFEGKTFLEWSRDKDFEISSNMHPLEPAHSAAADYMIKIVDKQKIAYPVQQVHV